MLDLAEFVLICDSQTSEVQLGPKKPRQEQRRKRLRPLYTIWIHTYIYM